ncbi:MAG: phytanoyl-CoA dioxygenase family protein [Actinobacteria bacterium]|nr:phytanoyl-CoA dioxygenase family protein [Actinomycetota bacterium]
MITRQSGYLQLRDEAAPPEVDHLQREGWVLLKDVFTPDEVTDLEKDIDRVFDEIPPDERNERAEADHWAPFRYEMLNRSEVCQRAIAHPRILEVIEPLLGEDCHVIANTAWRQPPEPSGHGGRFWHIDSGPHIPRPADVPWDDRIPYPVFAVAAHLYVWDCPLEAGPTGVLPRSHTSGQPPPLDRAADTELEWGGQGVVPMVADAGDVALFVSDVWHRRLPSLDGDPGRYFLQCHYGRRDLAQRLRPTSVANQLSDDAIARAQTKRERTLIGLHRPLFYDG